MNGDGVVNSADSTIMKQYLRGTTSLTGIYAVAADINDDGAINNIDISNKFINLRDCGNQYPNIVELNKQLFVK